MTSSPAAFRIKALCTVIVKLTNRDVELRLKQAGIRINIGSLMVLRMLQHGPLTIQEVGARLILTPATLIPIVDDLERKGLIVRGVDAKDRRKCPVHITQRGTSLLHKTALLGKKSKIVTSVAALGDRSSCRLIALLEELTTSLSGDDTICRIIERNVNRTLVKNGRMNAKKELKEGTKQERRRT